MLESSTNNIMWLPWWCRNPELHLTKKNRKTIDRLLTRFIVITDFMPDAGLQAHISYIVEGKTSASLPDQSSHPPLSCSASGSYLLTIFQSTYKLCCSTLLYSTRKKSNNVRTLSLTWLATQHARHVSWIELEELELESVLCKFYFLPTCTKSVCTCRNVSACLTRSLFAETCSIAWLLEMHPGIETHS
jgi:hypothetical protein